MFSFSSLKYVAILVSIVAAFSAGWMTRGWQVDSEELASHKAVQQAQTAIAKQLEEKLQDLKANERVVEREKLKIIEKPVYRNVCLDTDGVRLINQAKHGSASQPASQVP